MTPTNAADAVRRINEGWKMIRSTEAVIRETRALLQRR
jgi:pyridoxal biosynthesis lyase PdxS